MREEIVELQGREPGTTSIVLVGVHGDETCGVMAMQNLLPSLNIDRGTVLFGYGNPRAIEANKRYTEANLNRLFVADEKLTPQDRQSYEYQRVQFLKEYLDTADALLDIHSSSIPHSRKFAICEANAGDIIRFLPVDLVVSGFDQVEPGGTDYYMNSMGKTGICLECGVTGDEDAVRTAELGILAFLAARGHIEQELAAQKQSHIRMFQKYYSKTDTFILSRQFDNFELLEEGQLIGLDGTGEVRTPSQSYILFAHNGSRIGDEVFLLGKEEGLV